MSSSNIVENVKVLVAGDVEGNFKELVSRVSKVNEKNGPFSMLLCVGNFFHPESELINSNLPDFPIPTFILGPCGPGQGALFPNMSGAELSHNLTYLGRNGIYTESSGLKIAYLSGIESKNSSFCKEYEFNEDDVHSLQIRISNEGKGVDILLTSQWPSQILNNTTALPETIKSMTSSSLISQLALLAKPRYHFSGLEGAHFERAPYRNHVVLSQSTTHVTRFISLAKVGNKEKKKWLYAFSIAPMTKMEKSDLLKQPADVTENPYTAQILEKSTHQINAHDGNNGNSTQFFYNLNKGEEGEDGKKRKNKGENNEGKKVARRTFEPGTCWFCLASPQVEKHLVISIGEGAYLTLAKGGLTDDHVLILPIGHFQSTIECPKEVVEEMEKFKSSLRQFFTSQGKGVVFFERNYKSPHCQIQAVPVPSTLISSLKSLSLDFGDANEVEFELMGLGAELFHMTRIGLPYFFMELPDGSKLFCGIKKGFDLQFGRELLASPPILNLQDRVDWKNCKGTKEEETELTEEFRNKFKPFDFTLD